MAKRYARSAYRMTSARRAALRKAQLASARKRKRNRKVKKAAAAVGAVGVIGATVGAGVYRHKASGSKITVRKTTGHGLTGPLPGRQKGYVTHGPVVDLDGFQHKQVVAATRSTKKGRRIIIKYEHRSLTGKKVKGNIHRPRHASSYDDSSTSINAKISNSPQLSAMVQGRTPTGGAAESRIVNNKKKPGARGTKSKVKHPFAQQIMRELYGENVKFI